VPPWAKLPKRSEKAADDKRLTSMKPSSGPRIICLTAIPSCWNANFGSTHWNGDAVKISPWTNSRNLRASAIHSQFGASC
jgi:hypothetical protein